METGATAVVGRGLVEILPDFRKWGAQLAADMRVARAQLDGSAAGLRRSAATVGASMAKVGKGVTAVGVGVAAVSVHMAADFQSHTAVLQTAAGETTKGLAVVREGIKNIAVGTGTGIQNLTDGMYTIEKAGFRGAEGLKVLNAAAQGAREENAKLSDVTNAMTSVMASYHLSANDSVRVMNAMKTAAGEGKITMEEFSGALSTVLPIASANHIAFEDVAGSMATLTQHGTSAREATHELAATIRALASPNNVASREMARFGLSAVDVSKNLGKRGLSGTVNLLVETILKRMGPAGIRLQNAFEGTRQASEDLNIMLGKMSPSVRRVAQDYLGGKYTLGEWRKEIKSMSTPQANLLRQFAASADRAKGFSRELKNGSPASQTFTDALKKMAGGAIGLNTVLQITGESSEGNAERIKKVGESFHNNSKDVEGWKITAGLLNVQIDRMKAQFQVLAIDIGTKLIPVVSRIVGYFAQHRDVTLKVVAAVGVLAGVLVGAYIAQKLYATYTRAAAIATGAWNLAMQLGARYALGTRIQLAALFVWQKLQATWTGIVTAAQWAWNAAMTANPIGLIIVGIGLLVGAIVLIATKTQWFQKLWSTVWGAIKGPVMAVVEWITSAWDTVWGLIKKGFNAFADWFKANWQLITFTIITGGIGLIAALIVRHWGTIKKGAQDLYHAVVGWFVRIGKDIGHFFAALPGQIAGFFSRLWSVISAFFAALPGRIASFASRLWGAVSGFFSALPGRIAGFFTGLWAVIGPVLARLPGQIGGFFSRLPGQLAGFFTGLWKVIADWFRALPGRIMALVRTVAAFQNAMLSAGKDLIAGLFHGAVDFFTKSVPAFFKTVWHGIVDYFKAVFGIHSPSTVMAALGVNLMEGLLNGALTIAATITTFLNTHVVQPIKNFFTKTIPAAAGWLRSRVVGEFNLLRTGVSTAYNWVRDHVFSPIGSFFTKTIPGWAGTLKSRVVAAWQLQVNTLRTLYNWVRDHVFSPIGNFFTKTIPGWAASLRDRVVGRWSSLLSGLSGVYGSIKSRIFNPIGHFFTKTIPGWASTMKSKVTGFFGDMRDGIGRIWNGIKDKAKSPINWVLDHVWNHGIYSIWGTITKWIGIGNKLGKVKLLAAGGTVGNEPFGMFNKPTAIVGEGNSAYPEYVIPTDPKYATRARALWEQAGAHFYAGGGIIGTIGSALSSAAGKVADIGKGAIDFFTDPVGKAKKLLEGPLKGLARLGESPWVKMAARLPHMAVDGLIKAVKSVGSSILGGAGLGSSGGHGVERWRPTVLTALRMAGQVPALADTTLRRMNQESGGNPTAVNRTDINWQRGTPSVGLMQVIGPTFRAYAGKMRSVGPFLYGVSTNGLANLYASMRYALSRYGSLSAAYNRPGGYRLGTMGASAGWHWLGEDGPELAKLPAGTRIRSARTSARQAPAAGAVVHMTVENHGVIASRQEAENWLVTSLETLRVKRRLPRALGGN